MGDAVEHEYKFYKSKEFPSHLCCICKRKDVDGCLELLGLEPPFHDLWLGWLGSWNVPHELRSPKRLPKSFEIAEATMSYNLGLHEFNDYRRTTRSLKIGLSHCQIVQSVREPFLRKGLPKLIRWLDQFTRLPDTALTENLALHVVYDVKEGRLQTWRGKTRAGTMRKSP